MTALTDKGLNLKIAESLEPRPEYKASMRIDGVAQDLDGQFSKLKAWVYVIHQSGCEGCGWMPRDFVNDPAMTVMLMEKIIREYSHIVFENWPDGCRLTCHRLGGQPEAFIAEEIGRSIAEAYARAKGLL